MASIDVENVLSTLLAGFDEEILAYIISIVGDMSLEERKSSTMLLETIAPFLLDAGFVDSDSAAEELCKKISVSFGGSGYKNAITSVSVDLEAPVLLNAPVKMIDKTDLKEKKQTYGGAVLGDGGESSLLKSLASNSLMDVAAIPTTQKEVRKQRKQNEQQQRAMRAEALARAEEQAEMARARMAAIRASRASGRQALTGVNLDRFTLPHPSGKGDLLTEACLVLSPGRRYGLIGRNGAGKSTLMRALANYKFDGLTHLRVLLVDQHVEGDDDSALRWLLRADVERTSLLEEESRLSSYLHGTASGPLPADLKGVNLEVALTECYERMEVIGVSSAEQRARKILTGLGFSEPMMERPTSGLSGGWAMRAALGAALFVKPNLLLLDEPTNHLDLHALVWLENWLTLHFNGMVIIVSHDKFFLNNVCTDILELRSILAGQLKNSLEHYSGDYRTFEVTVEDRKKAQARAKEAYEKEKEKLKEFISREGKKYDNPAHQAQRKMKIKQLAQLVEIEAVEEDADVVIRLPTPYGSFDPSESLVGMALAGFAWPGEEPLFSEVDFSVRAGARLAIMGKNGCGKTSLLNILIGDAEPTSGAVQRHLGCRVTMLQQHHYRGEQLDPSETPLEHIRNMPQEESTAVGRHDPGTRQEETAIRGYLSNFGIVGPRAVIPVKYLSGGQRMRVAMAVALFRRPDVLILDEPTNHLDGATVDALCIALESYEGAIIAVSHDEAFVNRVISGMTPGEKAAKKDAGTALGGELWVLSKRRLNRFEGSFAAYKKLIKKKIAAGEGMDI